MPELRAAIDQLADDLVTPIVPGEVEGWLSAVYKSAELTSALLWRHMDSVRSSEYVQIVDEDPELFRRVEQMKAKDHECLEELATLLDRLKKLQARAGRKEPNETAMKDALDALVEQGLDFVNHARRQEKAREVWLAEAYNRDRGVGD